MPAMAGLLDSAAVVNTIAPLGFFVGADWPTIYSGTTPSRHQFLCSGLVRGGTYELAGNGPIAGVDTVWEACSRRGMRVASLDAPHAGVPEELNGVQLVEWGCHDRHATPRSYPARFVDEVNDTYGPHFGTRDHDLTHFSPCDWLHRSGRHRTPAEDRRLLADVLESHLRKRALTLDLLDRGDWDLFFSVIGESHCTGHQFWKFHDREHQWHDPQARRLLGTDPLRAVYGAIDETVGMALERAGRDTTVFVHLSHGMRSHYDAPVCWTRCCGASTSTSPVTPTEDGSHGQRISPSPPFRRVPAARSSARRRRSVVATPSASQPGTSTRISRGSDNGAGGCSRTTPCVGRCASTSRAASHTA
jgi:predicted AlkP superfamily phosphohydrolase/phosphomutase